MENCADLYLDTENVFAPNAVQNFHLLRGIERWMAEAEDVATREVRSYGKATDQNVTHFDIAAKQLPLHRWIEVAVDERVEPEGRLDVTDVFAVRVPTGKNQADARLLSDLGAEVHSGRLGRVLLLASADGDVLTGTDERARTGGRTAYVVLPDKGRLSLPSFSDGTYTALSAERLRLASDVYTDELAHHRAQPSDVLAAFAVQRLEARRKTRPANPAIKILAELAKIDRAALVGARPGTAEWDAALRTPRVVTAVAEGIELLPEAQRSGLRRGTLDADATLAAVASAIAKHHGRTAKSATWQRLVFTVRIDKRHLRWLQSAFLTERDARRPHRD